MSGGRPAGTAILIAAACLLTACAPGLPADQVTMGDVIVIGAPMSLTGNQSKEGALTKQGYDLWADWVDAHGGITVQGVRHRVQIRYLDDASTPDVSGQVAQQLITADGAKFLFGSYGSGSTAADAAVAEKNQIPLIAPGGGARSLYTRGYQYVFGVQSPADSELRAVLDMAATMHPRPAKVAVLSADDSFSVEVARSAAGYASQDGMQVVFDSQYPSGSTNLLTILQAVKAKKPDIVLNVGYLIEAVAVTEAARDVRLDASILAYDSGPSTPDLVRALGTDAEYVYTSSQWSAALRSKATYGFSAADFVNAYHQRYAAGETPASQVASAAAAGLALQRALEQANSLAPARVRGALASLDIATFYGRVKFDAQGQNVVGPVVVEQIQQNQPATVWPRAVATAAPLYPTPPWATRTTLPPR